MRSLCPFLLLIPALLPSFPAAAQELAGTWQFRQGEHQVVLALAPDGTFTRIERDEEGEEGVGGTWRVEGATLRLTPRFGDPIDLRWRLEGPDRLHLTTPEGRQVAMAREGGRARPPAGPDPNPGLKPDLARLRPAASGRILFTRYVPMPAVPGGVPMNRPTLHAMDGEGGGAGPFLVPDGVWRAMQAAWAPGAKAVLFASNYEHPRSSYWIDLFLADLATGRCRRLTGLEGSAGPVKGTGTLTGTISCPVSLVNPAQEIGLSYQGGGGRVFHPDEGWRFRIPGVPAGKLWVKAWVNTHVGAWQVVDVDAGGVGRADLDLRSGNVQAILPGLAPDGRYAVYQLGRPWYDPTARTPQGTPIPQQGHDTVAVLDLLSGLDAFSWPGDRAGKSRNPRLSPDGSWVAFELGEWDRESIAVIALADLLAGRCDAAKVVVPARQMLGAGIAYLRPSWSPDGRRLACVQNSWNIQGVQRRSLCVVGADGAAGREVFVPPPNQAVAESTWSPDGRRIAFTLLTGEGPAFQALDLLSSRLKGDIWTVGADGADPQALTRDGASCEPAWGP